MSIDFWTQDEAAQNQISQEYFGESSCCQAAVLTAFKILGVEWDKNHVKSKLNINYRACNCAWYDLHENCDIHIKNHLIGRSTAGISPLKLDDNYIFTFTNKYIDAIENVSNEQLTCKFVPHDCIDKNNLFQYINTLKNNIVPVLILNTQIYNAGPYDDHTCTPDYWHSQTIFKSDNEGVYLTNPIEKISYDELYNMLFSDSIIKIKKNEVLHHCKKLSCDEIKTIKWPNKNWEKMNVTQQLLDVYKKNDDKGHISIPYSGKAGVLLIWKN
jgi:hypothetical protein